MLHMVRSGTSVTHGSEWHICYTWFGVAHMLHVVRSGTYVTHGSEWHICYTWFGVAHLLHLRVRDVQCTRMNARIMYFFAQYIVTDNIVEVVKYISI
jgi:hypothetical protein